MYTQGNVVTWLDHATGEPYDPEAARGTGWHAIYAEVLPPGMSGGYCDARKPGCFDEQNHHCSLLAGHELEHECGICGEAWS